jgi:uncharacterized protein YukE
MVGGDPDQMEQLAQLFDVEAHRIDTITKQLGSRLVTTPWVGHGADRFRSDWNRHHRGELAAARDYLHNARDTLLRQAAEQRHVSSSGGGSLSGAPLDLPGWFTAGLAAALGPNWRALLGSPPTVSQIVDVLRRAGQLEKFLAHPELTLSAQKEWGTFVQMGGSTHGVVGGASVDASGSVAFQAGAEAHGSAKFTPESIVLAGGASAGVMATAMGAASISRGPLGASVHGQVTAQARAYAEGSATLDKHGLKAQGEAGAMAGVSASAGADASVGGVGAGVGVTGYAGAGVMAKATAEVTAQHVEVTVKLGVALGLGAGANVHVDVQPDKVAHEVMGGAHALGHLLGI